MTLVYKGVDASSPSAFHVFWADIMPITCLAWPRDPSPSLRSMHPSEIGQGQFGNDQDMEYMLQTGPMCIQKPRHEPALEGFPEKWLLFRAFLYFNQ